MSTNRDPKTLGQWVCQFYYTDWTGKREKKYKRGFAMKRDTLKWEQDLLKHQRVGMSMKPSTFADLYLEDMGHRPRASTLDNKRFIYNLKIKPYLGEKPMNAITPPNVRKWQNKLMSAEHQEGKKYSPTYLKTVNNQLAVLFNYAVKYYGLRENPCYKAGSIGKKNAEEMQFRTTKEYKQFREAVKDKPRSYMAFQLLYYIGMRIGELTALTKADTDLDAGTMMVSKSYNRLNGEDITTPPKTPKSNQIIAIPDFLCDELRAYLAQLYDLQESNRISPFIKYFLEHETKRGCKVAGVKRIRLHDLWHSYASLPAELGSSLLLIAEWLGHEKVGTTLNIYSHLWPHKQNEVVVKLQGIELPGDSTMILENPEKQN